MSKMSDRDRVSKLEKDWDEIVGREAKPTDNFHKLQKSPLYEAKDEGGTSGEDENLTTVLGLLGTASFDTPLGKMFAIEAERIFPHTLKKLWVALDKARFNNNPTSSEMKERIRGMILATYCWAVVVSRTGQLGVRDSEILGAIFNIAGSSAGTDYRAMLTRTAETRLESSIGTILIAQDSATRKGNKGEALFYEGAALAVYGLANLHYGVGLSYTNQ